MSNKYKLRVLWGEAKDFEDVYTFKTLAERNAFILGVQESTGYFDYEMYEVKEQRMYRASKKNFKGEINESM